MMTSSRVSCLLLRQSPLSSAPARPLLPSVRRGCSEALVATHLSDIRGRALLAQCKRPYHASSIARFAESPKSSQQRDALVLYDSLTDSYKALLPRTPEKGLAFYMCGPTTYAPAHLGHARTYVCLDIVRRVLEHSSSNRDNPPPLFVMNITDVDDKILAAAAETGETPFELARRYEEEFWKDWDALGCLRPHVVTRVTEHVETDLVPYIERLMQLEMAYNGEDGVYFDVRAYEEKMGFVTKYGKLAPPSASSDFFSSHGPTDTKKRDARDFVLWKNRKEGESLFWPSPWGEGRPGWHIECSAMIESVQKQFRDTHEFCVHAGGVDLKFPHHTNEIAQAEAYHLQSFRDTGDDVKEWIPHWVHTGHLHIQGMKMSKSLKNFITVQEMLSEGDSSASADKTSLSSPADDFRLWCLGLSGSYRGPATYSKDRLDEARITREKLVRFLLDGEEWVRQAHGIAPKRWNNDDHALFVRVQEASVSCHRALMGNSSSENHEQTREFDLDGSTYVEEMIAIAEAGNIHLGRVSLGNAPIEPVQSAIDTLRELLSLVGFSDATIRAGLDLSQDEARSHVVGGERALVEELVRFRFAVRKAALTDIRDQTASSANVKEILNLCDNARENVFPTIGLELLDGKVDGDTPDGAGWRFCVPKDTPEESSAEPTSKPDKPAAKPILDVPVEDLFRTGRYEGMFSEFNEDGIPLLNADGSEVSKRLRKKLLKKRDKHKKRLLNEAST